MILWFCGCVVLYASCAWACTSKDLIASSHFHMKSLPGLEQPLSLYPGISWGLFWWKYLGLVCTVALKANDQILVGNSCSFFSLAVSDKWWGEGSPEDDSVNIKDCLSESRAEVEWVGIMRKRDLYLMEEDKEWMGNEWKEEHEIIKDWAKSPSWGLSTCASSQKVGLFWR